MDGLIVCGGGPSSKTTCLTFTSGEWVVSHTLVNQRMVHVSWQTDQGLLLMGGGNMPLSSELVPMGWNHLLCSTTLGMCFSYIYNMRSGNSGMG